jgi:hypothetical protein
MLLKNDPPFISTVTVRPYLTTIIVLPLYYYSSREVQLYLTLYPGTAVPGYSSKLRKPARGRGAMHGENLPKFTETCARAPRGRHALIFSRS